MNSFDQLADKQLIDLYVQQGNTPAFNALLLRYREKIFGSLYFMVKDRYLAEDMLQEVFIKIIDTMAQGKYNHEGKFLPWALRIAHNLCIDHFRKVKRSPKILNNEGLDIFNYLNSNDNTQEAKMIRNQNHGRLHQMLSKLPDDQKEVLVLRHFGNLSFKEIADITGCSINTALGRMRYGLLNLRKLMVSKELSC
jgi:RNA polymerase sigma factor (sigma-70 family)